MFFSIIIPVYKVEDYLRKCIDSILIQSFEDFEIILVNDGSPDNSASICDEYSENERRIKVIHKSNEGSSAARNDGIKRATGDYLIFVDSDDYWEGTTALQSIYNRLQKNNVDVLLFGYKILNVKTGMFSISKSHYNSDLLSTSKIEEAIEYLFENDLFPGSAWVVVAKREMIRNENIYFEKGLIAEDVDWLIKLFSSINTIDSVSDVFYVYLKNRTDSISNTSGKIGVESILFILDKWVPLFLERNNDENSKFLLRFLAFHYSTVFLTYAYLTKNDKKLFKLRLKKYFFMFQYLNTFKTGIIKIVLITFGLDTGSILLAKIYKFLQK